MSTRRRRERARRLRATAALVLALLALGATAASPGARLRLMMAARDARGGALAAVSGIQAAFSGREAAQSEMTLPALRVVALQLGVYDNGELAQQEQQRLWQAGVPCLIWQRERMRIVCAAGLSGSDLTSAQAAGLETYVIEDELPQVRLRLGGARRDLDGAAALLSLPDEAFRQLLLPEETKPLSQIVSEARQVAAPALSAKGESELYAQLAKSVVNWCDLIERSQGEWGSELARQYAAVTMCTLCRELRAELLAQQSA